MQLRRAVPCRSAAAHGDTLGNDGTGSMRLATWNLWWRFGDGERRAAAITATLRELRPDVVGLQEVWGTPRHDLAGRLGAELGLHSAVRWLPDSSRWQRRLAGTEGVWVGNAVLSRWPLAEVADAVLPTGGAGECRAALRAVVDAPRGRLPFLTAQLSSAPHDSAVRLAQVDFLAGLVARSRRPGDLPSVVVGDFNAQPDSDEIRRFGGHLTAPAVPGQVLLDAWAYADDGSGGHTWDRRNPWVARTTEPSARIDYVFLEARPSPPSYAVERVGTFGAGPVDGVWPSDHAGVLADVAVAGRPA